MEVCVLGSGSKGNCTYISAGSTAILVDAGINRKQTLARMEQAGIDPGSVQAIFFTHSHSDHCSAVPQLAKTFNAGLYASGDVADSIDLALPGQTLEWTVFETGQTVEFGDLRIESFPVPHDVASVGYVFDDGGSRLFYATDLGSVTDPVRRSFNSCDAAILESNHDPVLLRSSDRPEKIKMRIAGRSGHLSNDDACELVAECASERLRLLLLAHLSEDCNSVRLALDRMNAALSRRGCDGVRVAALRQHEPSPFFTL